MKNPDKVRAGRAGGRKKNQLHPGPACTAAARKKWNELHPTKESRSAATRPATQARIDRLNGRTMARLLTIHHKWLSNVRYISDLYADVRPDLFGRLTATVDRQLSWFITVAVEPGPNIKWDPVTHYFTNLPAFYATFWEQVEYSHHRARSDDGPCACAQFYNVSADAARGRLPIDTVCPWHIHFPIDDYFAWRLDQQIIPDQQCGSSCWCGGRDHA